MTIEITIVAILTVAIIGVGYLGIMFLRLNERINHVYNELSSVIAVSFRIVDEELATLCAHLRNPGKRRRLNQRYRVDIESRIEQEQRVYLGKVSNVSANGLFFETDKAASLSGVVVISLPNPTTGEEVRLSGRVVHTMTCEQAVANGGQPGVGILVTQDPSRVLSAWILHVSMQRSDGKELSELPVLRPPAPPARALASENGSRPSEKSSTPKASAASLTG